MTLKDETNGLSRNVGNYESTLRNIPEERRKQSRSMKFQFTNYFISIHFNIILCIICVVLNNEAQCVLHIGQAFRYTPENAFYIFSQQIYFII